MDLIAVQARLQPQRLAARDLTSQEQWTYEQFDRLIGGMVAELAGNGIVSGDRVALLARNSVRQVALHFACARLGAIFAPLNWRLSAGELAGHLALAEPALLMSDALAPDRPAGGAILHFADFNAAAARRSPVECGVGDLDLPSLILFTSGTSGQSKGVLLSERNLRETAIGFGALTRVDSRSRFLCEAPMFHVIGLVTNIRPVLMQGGAILVSDGFDAPRTLDRLCDPDLGVTHFVGVPQMMESLRRQTNFDPAPLRRLVALVSGGAPHDPADQRAWNDDGIPVALGYGMSEVGTVFGMPADCEVIGRKIGSVGVSMPGIGVSIRRADASACATGEAGELHLRGDNVMRHYWRNPEESARAIDSDGWFATGDIVRRDEDGFYWIVDRKKDMFISGGENVYPAEIEAHLRSTSELADYALVGVPDSRWGEVGHLVIVPQVGATVDVDAIRSHLAGRLASYKLPKYITFANGLPRTTTGKLQRALLRKQLADVCAA